jgi:hypothetical protein
MSDDPLDVDLDLDRPAAPEARRDIAPRRSRTPAIIGVAAALALALALAYVYLRAPNVSAPDAGVPTAQPKEDASRGEPGDQIILPPLDETDALVRELVGKLSSNPTVAAWLTTDGLILNFALVTRQISNGESPTKEMGALGGVPAFRPRTSRDNLYVDAATYRRYDRFALAISSLDARGTARLYATLAPRINDAYRRMGQPAGDFDPVLERAIVEMLKVPVVHGEPELAPSGIVYAYVDPRLESLSNAQKHLLRMGPKNVAAIQEKLREVADYLGIPGVRLPRPSALTLTE